MPTPANSRSKLVIATLAGVRDANIHNGCIAGTWKEELHPLRSKTSRKTIVEQFVNFASDPESVVRFVRRFGPLCKPEPSGTFRQSIQEWRAHQSFVRKLWSEGPALSYRIGMKEGEQIVFSKDLTLVVEDLGRFLEFEVFVFPGARRRVCKRPDCPNPYFIARHLRQRLCSEPCNNWAQRNYKLEWWRDKGVEWRKTRK